MARRSLKASTEGIDTIKATLKRKKWSQTFLAGAAGRTRQTVWSLLHGNPIDAEVFLAICTQLGLSEHEIAEASQAEAKAGEVLEIDELVRQVRAQIKPWIQERYGSMNVLSMTRPIGLGDIYTDINILEKITGRKRLPLKELEANCQEEDFDRYGFSDLRKVERVPGLDAVERCRKMVVLGKPGAGKTTFLKRIATQCNLGTFHPGLVPIFVPLKQFAEIKGHPELLDYIANQWDEWKVREPESNAERLLYGGRALVLLDGLDEVAKADSSRVIEGIRQFSERFYNNLYVLTCRIATHEFKLEPFTEVEIADFDDQQIAVFVTKWFELKKPERTESFLRKLKDNPRIRELATNPLLLTLLCLGFEEAGYFSDNRAGLYKESLSVLLKGWDAKRGIDRDIVYRRLTPDRKEDLLSQLAYQTFEQGQYFFGEEIAKQKISDYIANLPDAETDAEKLGIDSRAVLKSIEGQHGLLLERSQEIYSFSHLTFQEYFTARKIAASCNPYANEDKTLQRLANQISDKRWQEVFLLVLEILPSADYLLLFMKQKIDKLLEKDDILQRFLDWSRQKTDSVKESYKPASVRAFYLQCSFVTLDAISENRFDGIARNLVNSIQGDTALFDDIARSYGLNRALNLALDNELITSISRNNIPGNITRILNTQNTLESELQVKLQSLISQLIIKGKFKTEFKKPSQALTRELRNIMIKHRNIGHFWPLNLDQVKLLNQYLEATLFLVKCLNSKSCYITRSVRQEIEDTLLLPIAEIERRKSARRE
jgi:predicted NACHT family NTPase